MGGLKHMQNSYPSWPPISWHVYIKSNEALQILTSLLTPCVLSHTISNNPFAVALRLLIHSFTMFQAGKFQHHN